MSRGTSVYQDLAYIFYIVCTNAIVMTIVVVCLLFFLSRFGYRGITIKLKKNNKLTKEQKSQEQRYISRLEKNVKKKKHK